VKRHLAVRVSLTGALLSLLMLSALPVPVLAAGESIDVDPERGSVGDNVRVSGEGFDASYRKSSGDWVYSYVKVYYSWERGDIGDGIDVQVEDYEIVDKLEKVDRDGEWKISFTVPAHLTDGEIDEDVTGDTYYIYVTYKGEDEVVAIGEYEVKEACFSPYGMWFWSGFSSSGSCSSIPWYGPRRPYFIEWPVCSPCSPDVFCWRPDETPWSSDHMPLPPIPDWHCASGCD